MLPESKDELWMRTDMNVFSTYCMWDLLKQEWVSPLEVWPLCSHTAFDFPLRETSFSDNSFLGNWLRAPVTHPNAEHSIVHGWTEDKVQADSGVLVQWSQWYNCSNRNPKKSHDQTHIVRKWQAEMRIPIYWCRSLWSFHHPTLYSCMKLKTAFQTLRFISTCH